MSNTTGSNGFTVPTCTYTREGYTFKGWQNGSTIYQPGQVINDLSTLTVVNGQISFVAVWELEEGTGFTISFDGNGGTGTTGSLNYEVGGNTVTIPRPNYTRTGYNFAGWATTPGGDPDPDYEVGSHVTVDKDLKLYAVWAPISYYIIYHSNGTETEGGDSNISGEMTRTTGTYDKNVQLTENNFVNSDSNYAFAGWSTTPNGNVVYVDGATVTNLTDIEDDEIDLYAVWVEKKPITITFNNNGGSGTMNDLDGKTYTDINLTKNTMERDGYTFLGWATEEGGAVVYRDGETINVRGSEENLVLYAVWKRNKTPTGSTLTGKGSGKTTITNPQTGRTSLIIVLVILSCIGASYLYSKRNSY